MRGRLEKRGWKQGDKCVSNALFVSLWVGIQIRKNTGPEPHAFSKFFRAINTIRSHFRKNVLISTLFLALTEPEPSANTWLVFPTCHVRKQSAIVYITTNKSKLYSQGQETLWKWLVTFKIHHHLLVEKLTSLMETICGHCPSRHHTALTESWPGYRTRQRQPAPRLVMLSREFGTCLASWYDYLHIAHIHIQYSPAVLPAPLPFGPILSSSLTEKEISWCTDTIHYIASM